MGEGEGEGRWWERGMGRGGALNWFSQYRACTGPDLRRCYDIGIFSSHPIHIFVSLADTFIQ